MSTTNPIDPFKDVTVRSEEMKRADKKQPVRNFSEVTERIEERRPQREDEGTGENKDQKKRGGTASTLAKSGEMAPAAPLSLFDLAREQGRSKKEEKEEPDFEEPEEQALVKQPRHSLEQPDLSAANPVPKQEFHLQPVLDRAPAQKLAFDPKAMQEIIDQIVKHVYTVKGSEGLTETVVELEGRFKGARLIIKEFDFAKNEMNITIDQLKSGSDQQLLHSHRQELVDKLAKDYQITVHIFTVTTATEPTQLDYKPGREEFAKGQQGEQKEQKQNEEETEES